MPAWPKEMTDAVLESVNVDRGVPTQLPDKEMEARMAQERAVIIKQMIAIFLMLSAVIMCGVGGLLLWGAGGCLLSMAVPMFVIGFVLATTE